MDLSTIAGLGLGLLLLAAALILGHVPLDTLLNPEAIIIVFGGTVAATLVSFDQRTLMQAFLALGRDGAESRHDIRSAVAYVMDVVGFVRDEGILALQPVLESIEIPFFRKGLSLVLDNRSEKFIRDSLSTEIEVIYRDGMEHARVLETAGGYAPTMGIIGAVIGLIFVVQSFQNPGELGKGVASAFSATLYGVALANLFLLPLAAKLRQRVRNEAYLRTLLLEAVLSIRSGEHPMLIEERLNAFVSGDTETREPKTYATAPSHYSASPASGPAVLPPGAVLSDDFLQVGMDA